MPPFKFLGLIASNLAFTCVCVDQTAIFFLKKNHQFTTWDLVVDHGSYMRLLLKLRKREKRERKGKEREKEGVGDLVAIRDSK